MKDPYIQYGGRAFQPGRFEIPCRRLINEPKWGSPISGVDRQ
jgi:hypothetical protein